MSERREHLVRITQDLEEYVSNYCPRSSGGEFSDFSGEACNDALLMLQDALNKLDETP